MNAFIHRENNNIAYSDFDITSREWLLIPKEVSFVAERLTDGVVFFFVGGAVDEDKYRLIWERKK